MPAAAPDSVAMVGGRLLNVRRSEVVTRFGDDLRERVHDPKESREVLGGSSASGAYGYLCVFASMSFRNASMPRRSDTSWAYRDTPRSARSSLCHNARLALLAPVPVPRLSCQTGREVPLMRYQADTPGDTPCPKTASFPCRSHRRARSSASRSRPANSVPRRHPASVLRPGRPGARPLLGRLRCGRGRRRASAPAPWVSPSVNCCTSTPRTSAGLICSLRNSMTRSKFVRKPIRNEHQTHPPQPRRFCSTCCQNSSGPSPDATFFDLLCQGSCTSSSQLFSKSLAQLGRRASTSPRSLRSRAFVRRPRA